MILQMAYAEQFLMIFVRLAGKDRLEYRSDIYKAIKKMDLIDQELETLRMYIDIFYNEKLSVSVSGGRGEFTMTDHTPDATIEQDFIEDEIADKTNDPYGLLNSNSL